MKMISTVALATALMMGAPAAAIAAGGKDRPQPDSTTAFNLSKPVRESAAAATLALKANNLPAAESAVASVEANASNDSEQFVAKTLRVKLLSMSPQDTRTMTALIKPLEELMADPRTSRDDLARYAYSRGDIAYSQKQYAKAVQYYLQARQGGLQDDELDYQIVRASMDTGNIAAGSAALDTLVRAQIAAGKKPPESWYRYAIARLYKANRTDDAAGWTANWLAVYGSRENWHDAVYNLGFQAESEKRFTDLDRIDLYRLMAASKSLAGENDYVAYAQAAAKAGLPTEAKAVIEEGRANGALPAGDKSIAALLVQANAGIARSKPFAAADKAAAGDAYLGARNYPKAIAMYDLALAKGSADAVHLHRGIAYALSGDKEKARNDLSAVAAVPQTELARLWITWLDAPVAS